jgi:hypothetical protein
MMKRIKVHDDPRNKPKAKTREYRYRPRRIKRIRPQVSLADKDVQYYLATIAHCKQVERECYRRLAGYLAATVPADLAQECSQERKRTAP